MLGAIIGDIVGSIREWHNVKTEDFELVPKGSRFTDDTVMTLAVAEWLMTDPEHRPETLVACMQRLGRKYPNAGYGMMFSQWLISDHPQPYNSFGNGSAMRVSPVGLYANSLDEALELARITASVSHSHPEGIKGARAIAGCVFLHKNTSSGAEDEVRRFISEKIGYNLDFKLDDIRNAYGFDVTCQGSVPIAIKAYLERSGYPAEKALRLAISMGGDSDTIGAMTASIASAEDFSVMGGGFSDELVNQCRELLPADLLDINDRFEAFVSRPLHQSYFVGGKLFAGEYPGDKYGELAEAKLKRMHHFGVRHFVDLTEEGELRPYQHLLPSGTTYLRFPIRDVYVPNSVEAVHQLIDKMEYLTQQEGYTYIHCWGGVGRTGTIVACYEARQMDEPTLNQALAAMQGKFAKMPKATYRNAPETDVQVDFVRRFVESCREKKYGKMKPVGVKKKRMYNREYTPERISELKENEVFVFGSNLAGAHGGGAARLAYERFGAVWGEGKGLRGQSYAIPTMQGGVDTIKPYVDDFIRFAKEHIHHTFLVTRIGCGIAGFRDQEIAPLFTDAIDVENIILPKEFVENIYPDSKQSYFLERFLTAHKWNYENALREITDGRKRTHWIWFIFPQLAVLGHSANAKYYGLSGYDEAKAYLEHPILGARLREITVALLQHRGESVVDILGDIDAVKVRSCMTLFDAVSPNDIFQEVLDAFYGGRSDKKTLDLM